jgi:hypothetical protein
VLEAQGRKIPTVQVDLHARFFKHVNLMLVFFEVEQLTENKVAARVPMLEQCGTRQLCTLQR